MQAAPLTERYPDTNLILPPRHTILETYPPDMESMIMKPEKGTETEADPSVFCAFFYSFLIGKNI